MGYQQLYDFCQQDALPVSRKPIREKVLQLTGIPKIRHVRTGLDTAVCRGFYLAARNDQHRLVAQVGSNVIVTARDLDPSWERFVYTKELMHAFDDPDEATDSGDRFDKLLTELSGPGEPGRSPQFLSEIECFWMALGALCPEALRRDCRDKIAKGQADPYEVSLMLKIPQPYVLRLIQDDFPQIIKYLLSRG